MMTVVVEVTKDNGTGQLIGSVQKALDILNTFDVQKSELSLTDLSVLLSMNKSTLFSLLRTLERNGYVIQNPHTKRYRLGTRLLERAALVVNYADVGRVAPPFLDELRDKVGENVHLGVLNDGEVVYLYRAQGLESLSVNSRPGMRAPAHCTAMGKAMLAFLPDVEQASIIARHGLSARTPHTITDPVLLQQHLQEIRQQGYAVDAEEHHIGSQCIAAPILDMRDQMVAAISVSVPSVRMGGARRSYIVQSVTEYGRTISGQLGWQAPGGDDIQG